MRHPVLDLQGIKADGGEASRSRGGGGGGGGGLAIGAVTSLLQFGPPAITKTVSEKPPFILRDVHANVDTSPGKRRACMSP